MKDPGDRLHRALRAEQKERIGLRLDVLTQMGRNVLFHRVIIHAGDNGLGGLPRRNASSATS
jgi:hypothetical protein